MNDVGAWAVIVTVLGLVCTYGAIYLCGVLAGII
jgi:hypothetical protein